MIGGYDRCAGTASQGSDVGHLTVYVEGVWESGNLGLGLGLSLGYGSYVLAKEVLSECNVVLYYIYPLAPRLISHYDANDSSLLQLILRHDSYIFRHHAPSHLVSWP